MSLSRLAAACVVTFVIAACGAEAPARSVQVTVPSGAAFGTIVDTLVQRGVVDHPRGFRLYARLVGADRRIRSGDYALTTGQRWRDLLAVLTEGRVVALAVTIPEGFTLADMADRVAETVQQPVDSVRAQPAWKNRANLAPLRGTVGRGVGLRTTSELRLDSHCAVRTKPLARRTLGVVV